MMRKWNVYLVWIACGLMPVLAATSLTAADADLLARFYFIGSAQLSALPDAAKINEVGRLATTRDLEEKALQKLAHAPGDLFGRRIEGAKAECGVLVRPLLDDLRQAEWVAEAHDRSPLEPEWTLAVRLSEDRAKIWNSNLSQLVALWRIGAPVAVKQNGTLGWEVKTPASVLFRFVQAGAWCVVGLGPDRLAAQAEMVKQIGAKGRPFVSAEKSWIEADADLARLTAALRIYGLFTNAPAQLPQVHLTVAGKAENVRTNLRLRYPENQTWQIEPWQMPTNALRDPLVSFTAVQGIGPWLSRNNAVRSLGINPLPNQFFSWSYPKDRFAMFTFAAVPVSDPTNVINRLESTLPGFRAANYPTYQVGEISRSTNRTELVWRNLPFLAPFLRPFKGTSTGFVIGGLFANYLSTNKPPAELFAQILGRTNLLYYQWEITQEQLNTWPPLLQLISMIAENPKTHLPIVTRMPPGLPVQPWFLELAPKLGNSVTELTVTSPRELALVRKSYLGLTGLELALLGRYLENAAFPLLGYQLPARPLPVSAKTSSKP